MSFSDPVTITVNGSSKSLTRITQDNYGAEYQLLGTTEKFFLKFRHSKEAVKPGQRQMFRHNVELTHTVYGSGGAEDDVRVIYAVIRHRDNADLTSVKYDLAALAGIVNDSSTQTGLLNWQS